MTVLSRRAFPLASQCCPRGNSLGGRDLSGYRGHGPAKRWKYATQRLRFTLSDGQQFNLGSRMNRGGAPRILKHRNFAEVLTPSQSRQHLGSIGAGP